MPSRATQRKLVTAATMTALVLLLVVMAVVGYKILSSPLESPLAKSSRGPTCAPQDQVVKSYVFRREVTVSVYNAGGIKGAAGRTMDAIERAGFKAGDVGNAPDGAGVDTVKVFSTEADDPGAELIAQFLGKDVQVVHTDEDYGPGVDVFIGRHLAPFNRKAPRKLKLAEPEVSCSTK